MLRIRSSILTRLLSSSAASPIFPLHRLLSTTAAAVPPNPIFAVQEYLVDTCRLTRAHALKASRTLSHIKSPTNPDSVLAFLAGLGFSSADIAAAVAKDPLLLCASVEKTLAPIVAGLRGLGLSHTEIARLVSLTPSSLRLRSVVSNVKYLQGCGLGACDIAKLFLHQRWLIGSKPERLQVMVASADGLGVPPGSVMFRHALHAVSFLSKEKIAAQVENLKNMFRWSDAEVGIAVCKAPTVLARSKDFLLRKSEFLISEVRLEPAYIAHRPVMLLYSLEGRLRPRYYVLKFLKEKGLVQQDRDYYSTLPLGENVFMKRFICPHMEAAPHLTEDYAAACKGEVPTRFRYT